MNKKKILIIGMLTKIPLLIYLIIMLTIVPAINAVEYNAILGAHRGSSIDHVENTLPAMQSAIKQEKYKFIEFDVRYTRDKKLVVFHDSTLLRLQKKLYSISNLSYEELQNISSYSIPLYEDVMNAIGKTKKINIEIKSFGDLESDKELVGFIVEDIKNRGILQNIMISSISPDIIKYVSEAYPNIKTGKIYWIIPSTYLHFDSLTENLYEEMREIGADYLMLHGANIHNIDSLIRLKPEDKTLCFWYFTDEMYIIQKDPIDQLW